MGTELRPKLTLYEYMDPWGYKLRSDLMLLIQIEMFYEDKYKYDSIAIYTCIYIYIHIYRI